MQSTEPCWENGLHWSSITKRNLILLLHSSHSLISFHHLPPAVRCLFLYIHVKQHCLIKLLFCGFFFLIYASEMKPFYQRTEHLVFSWLNNICGNLSQMPNKRPNLISKSTFIHRDKIRDQNKNSVPIEITWAVFPGD